MLRQRAREIAALVVVVDALILLACFVASVAIRTRLLPAVSQQFGSLDPSNYSWLPLLTIPVTILLLWRRGLYQSMRIKGYLRVGYEVSQVFCFAVLVMGLFIFLFQLKQTSRTLVALYLMTGYGAILGGKWGIRWLQRRVRSRSLNSRDLVIVGQGPRVADVVRELEANPELGFKLLGVMSDRPLEVPVDLAYLGRLHDIERVVKSNVIDAVFFVLPASELESLGQVILALDEMGTKIHLRVDFLPTLISRSCVEHLGSLPILTLTSVPHNVGALAAKRALDVVVSSAGLVILSPILVLCAAVVRLGGEGPMLFRQERIGLNGRRFVLYKFRTMVEGIARMRAEEELRNEVGGPVFKMKEDPRVTRGGRWLRRLSLDELPQLWNVLKGDMSLVGPRPPLQSEVSEYRGWHRRRLSVRPGMTCLWQINGRSEIDFEQWMAMDMYYIDHWSLALDMKILIQTVPAVLSMRGAQ